MARTLSQNVYRTSSAAMIRAPRNIVLAAADESGHGRSSRRAAVGASSGALVGSFFGPIGALVGGAVGAYLGYQSGTS